MRATTGRQSKTSRGARKGYIRAVASGAALDITDLIQKALSFEPEMGTWLASGELLTPFATRFRYPGTATEPEQADYEAALRAADGIYRFVADRVD